MINDILISLKDNIYKRSKNPILGTFTLVYIIHNWELFYSIFYFDSNLKLEQRLQYIRDYFQYHNFWENFFICISLTFGLVLLTYFSLALGHYISSFYSSKIEKWIFDITDNKKIVLKADYVILMEQKNKFESMYLNERKEKTNIIEEKDEMEKRYLEIISAKTENEVINNLKAEVESIRGQLNAKNMEVESLKNQNEDKDDKLYRLGIELNKIKGDKNVSIQYELANNIYKQIKLKELITFFETLIRFSSIHKVINISMNANNLAFFIDNNIIYYERDKIVNSEYAYIKFTTLGEQIKQIYLLEKNKKID